MKNEAPAGAWVAGTFLRLSRFHPIRGTEPDRKTVAAVTGRREQRTRGGLDVHAGLVIVLMLEKLRQIVAEFATSHERKTFDDNDYRLAAAALLVHLISIDGEPTEAERQKLHALLASRFELDDASVNELVATATRVEGEAVDLYHFTSLIMRSVDEQGRARIVEMMWELVFVDDHASEFEESVLWRSADLLGVSSTERIALKNRVAARRLAPDVSN